MSDRCIPKDVEIAQKLSTSQLRALHFVKSGNLCLAWRCAMLAEPDETGNWLAELALDAASHVLRSSDCRVPTHRSI